MHFTVLCSIFGLGFGLFPSVSGQFTFSAGSPTQCDDLRVTWSGGQKPLTLTVAPLGGRPRNVTVPATDTSSSGTITVPQLPYSQGQRLILTMSDATGFATGGTSDVLTTGASTSGTQCNVELERVDFFFQLDSGLAQCKPYPFTGFAGAQQPITVYGMIPSGQSFVLQAPTSPSNAYTWASAKLKAGTAVVFTMVDSAGRQGGTSDVRIVESSDDTSCLAGAPSSTSGGSGPSSTGGGTKTGTGKPDKESKSSLSGGAIGGIAAGGVFLILAIILVLYFINKRKNRSDDDDVIFPHGNPNKEKQYGELPHNQNYETTPFIPPSQGKPAGSVTNVAATATAARPVSQVPQFATNVAATATAAQTAGQVPQFATTVVTPQQLQQQPQFVTAVVPQQQPQFVVIPQQQQQPQIPQQYHPYAQQQYQQQALYQYQQPQYQYQYQQAVPQQQQQPLSQFQSPSTPSQMSYTSRPMSIDSSVPSSSNPTISPSVAKSEVTSVSQAQPRFILHNDITEADTQGGEQEVIELPPQYSDTRGPIPGIPPTQPGSG